MRERYLKTITVYLGVTLFCALFGGVYEAFGHGVFSFWMLYAFAFPLALGVVPFFLLMKHRRAFPSALAADAYHAGIATLTVGSLMTGALEIYGTTSPLLSFYWIIGGTLLAFGLGVHLIGRLLMTSAREKQIQ